ncbi:hypothetical protein HXX76_013792 [Chlamydomonas incerta]|uniref:mannan endo-1,4-beta-mannosidase n=1 Tax=Chlamydomonas incerta TaxID=51695 RepID=A0A835SDP3_CHLIN|nr:hypothetical protein HXX76_013792 [Chlamydomonas incerta]|eukprot:KAG2425378.1 hypothetical protein HXX76_013792 [Chlamydomonas incerta]
MPSHKGFVQRNGSSLALGNDAFYFAGANCHYLLTHAANEDQRPLVLEVLDDAQRLNLTVLRIWAFCDGPDEWNALQREPGQLSEHVLEGLDWLIEEAGRRGLRLLLVLTNYWPDYGGMPAYVRWRFGIPDRSSHNPQTHPTSLFYTDPQCQATFRRATAALLARVNRRTGLAYTADPTILGWDVANEPRCEGPGGADVVRDFVGSTAEFVKRLAPRQLVTVGLEGFFGASTPELLHHNPYRSAAAHGTDWQAVLSHPALDFACMHLYPDQWCPLDTPRAELKSFMQSWIRSHATLCAGRLNKPLVLSEFGKRDPGSYHGRDCSHHLNRTDAFKEVLDCCMGLAMAGGPLAGVCAWMLAARQYPDYDGYTLKLGPPAAAVAASATSFGAARRSSEEAAARAARNGVAASSPAGEAEWGSGRLDLGRDTGPLRDIAESAHEGTEEAEAEQAHEKDQDQHRGAPIGIKQGGGHISSGADTDVRRVGAASAGSSATAAQATRSLQQMQQVLHYSQYSYSGNCNQQDEPAVEALRQYGAVMKRLCLVGPTAVVARTGGAGGNEKGSMAAGTARRSKGGWWWCGLSFGRRGRG